MGNHWIKELSMWSNDMDYIIAFTLEEAKTYAGQVMFGKDNPKALELYEQFEADELDNPDWYELPKGLIFSYAHDDGTVEMRTIQHYINVYGPGYFACSEY